MENDETYVSKRNICAIYHLLGDGDVLAPVVADASTSCGPVEAKGPVMGDLVQLEQLACQVEDLDFQLCHHHCEKKKEL